MLAPSNRLGHLASPAFIVALALLVLNDFALKPLLHNALTGKLSDFAGLFALTLLVATLWPRHARIAGAIVAAAFTFWKTSYAGPVIESLNAVSPMAFARTVDLTDLVALPMVALAVWAAPRLAPWPLPRLLQIALVVVALVAFTATSRARYVARSTMDVTQEAAVDDTVLQTAFDEIADERGLRCQVCVSLSEGRVYIPEEEDSDVRALIVKLDSRTLNVTASGYDRERSVRVLSRRIRSELEERFPGLSVIDSETGYLYRSEGETTIFVVRGANESDAERSKETLSSLVGDAALAWGFKADAERYHTGDASEPEYSSLLIEPVLDEPDMLLVKVVSRSPSRDAELLRAVSDQLESRLHAAFGAENVTRHVSSLPVEWVY